MRTHRPRMMQREALVIGGGVIGLAAAIRLREAGWRVRVWAAELPGATTSAVAGAFWYPYRAYPADRVDGWARATFPVLRDQAAAGAPVRMLPVLDLWRRPIPDPTWADVLPDLRRLTPGELAPPYTAGHRFTAPVADMPRYLAFLERRLRRLGGTLDQRHADRLAELRGVAPTVVNCSGLGAGALVPDPTVFPIRGQVVRVANPGIDRVLLDEEHPDGLTYIVPRGDSCILGGTAEDHNASTAPDPAAAERILERCTGLEPRLRDARVLEHRVGLRPGRPQVRLEAEPLGPATRVIHNYGHGGSGLTLAWGCAAEVVRLAASG